MPNMLVVVSSLGFLVSGEYLPLKRMGLFLAWAVLLLPGNLVGASLYPCFQTYTNTETGTCQLASGRATLESANAIAFQGTRVHLLHTSTGDCRQGQIIGRVVAYIYPQKLSCLRQNGVNQYCFGACPEPLGQGGCYSKVITDENINEECENVNGVATLKGYDSCTGITPTALQVVETSQCIDLDCTSSSPDANVTLTVPGTTCDDLKGKALLLCYFRTCAEAFVAVTESKARGQGRRQALETGADSAVATRTATASHRLLEPDSAEYQAAALQCGTVTYDVFMYVDHHFYAIATPALHQSDGTDVTSCPIFRTEAQYNDDNQDPKQRVYRKRLTIVGTMGFQGQQQDPVAEGSVTEEEGAHVTETDAERQREWIAKYIGSTDSLYIGSFSLDQLRQAFEDIDPAAKESSSYNMMHAAAAYDVIANNCADMMLSFAAALKIKIDAKITSYVTRRLIKHAGRTLAERIRSSVHYGSLISSLSRLGGGDASSHSVERRSNNDNRNLLRSNDEPLDTITTSDEHLISALVQARVAEAASASAGNDTVDRKEKQE